MASSNATKGSSDLWRLATISATRGSLDLWRLGNPLGHERPNFKDKVQLHVPYSFAILYNKMSMFFFKTDQGTCYVYI